MKKNKFRPEDDLQIKLALKEIEWQEKDHKLPAINVLATAWNIPDWLKHSVSVHFTRKWETKYFLDVLPKPVLYPGQKSTYVNWEGTLYKVKLHRATNWEEINSHPEIFCSFRKSRNMPIGYVILKPWFDENSPHPKPLKD